jgi:hypothetical protein
MSAALAQVIGRKGKVDEVLISIHLARRHDQRTRSFVNWVASDCMVRLPVGPGHPLDTAAGVGRSLQEFHEVASLMDVNFTGGWHDRIGGLGSYSYRYVSSML